MKKITAFILSLCMVMSLTSAFAIDFERTPVTFMGAIASDGVESVASVEVDGEHQVALLFDSAQFELEPLYSGEFTSQITSSYGRLVDGKLTLDTHRFRDNSEVIDFTLQGQTSYVRVYKVNCSVNVVLDGGLEGTIDEATIKNAVDVLSDVSMNIKNVDITMMLCKRDAVDATEESTLELLAASLKDGEELACTITCAIIKDCDGSVVTVNRLQQPVYLNVPLPANMRDRQYYRVVHVHDGEAVRIEADGDDNEVSVNIDASSLYFVVAGPKVVDSTSVSDKFPDIPKNHWALRSIDYAVNRKIISGTDTGFDGDRNITRGEVAAILVRLSGNKLTTKNYFTDVPNNSWYKSYINTAYEMGITNGLGNGVFAPDKSVTREELATMLYRYINSPKNQHKATYNDVDEIDSWAKSAVEYMTDKKIVQGYDGSFYPRKNTTRYEAVEMIAKFIKNAGL